MKTEINKKGPNYCCNRQAKGGGTERALTRRRKIVHKSVKVYLIQRVLNNKNLPKMLVFTFYNEKVLVLESQCAISVINREQQ